MKITRIQISNFRLLSDVDIKIDVSKSNLAFINGSNGRGKTTLKQAIEWCVFGDGLPAEAVSYSTLRLAKQGETLDVTVSLEFEMGETTRRAIIEKAQSFIVGSDGRPSVSSQPVLTVKTQGANPTDPIEVEAKPDQWLSQYLPERFLNFFLFDGELMYKFFDGRVNSAIEDAVKEVAGVDLFESILMKMKEVESKLQKEVAKQSGANAQALLEKLEADKKLAGHLVSEAGENSASQKSASGRVREIDKTLANLENVEEDVRSLDTLRKLLVERGEGRKSAEADFLAELLRVGSTALMSEIFPLVQQQVEDAKQKGKLPPPFEPNSLRALLEQETCVCGEHLAAGDNKSSHIQELIDSYAMTSEFGRVLQETAEEAGKLDSRRGPDSELVKEKNRVVKLLDDSIRDVRKEIDRIKRKLAGHDVESIASLGKERQILADQLQKLQQDKAQIDRQASELESQIQRQQKLYDKAVAAAGALSQAARKVKFAEAVVAAGLDVHERTIESVRQRLEDAISDKFAIVKGGSFTTQITEDFEVRTLDAFGNEAQLAEGEKMLKAYVFSIALREVIGLSFPLIVDTPFGRLDETYKRELAEILAGMIGPKGKSSGSQAIFLMHSGEYTPYTRQHFAKAKPLETYLAFSKEDEKSTLVEGIDPEWFGESAWRDWKEGKIK